MAAKNESGKQVQWGSFSREGGERHRIPGTEGGPHVLRVIFKANPFKIELEAGAMCSICDSCLPEARGFELLTDFVSYV